MFGLFGGKQATHDLSEGQPGVGEAATAFAAEDWARLRALYLDRGPSDRTHFLRGLGELVKLEGALPSPSDADSCTVNAGIKVVWAWRYRGSGLGSDVGRKAGLNMDRLLTEAQRDVESAIEFGARDAVALAFGIRAEMGVGGDLGRLGRYLELARACEPNLSVAAAHLSFIAPKWHGSSDEMMSAAHAYANAPVNAAWIALLAFAHAEAWLYHVHMSDDREEQMRAHDYFVQSDAFAEKVGEIDDAFWRLHATAPPAGHAQRVFAHNVIAYLLRRRNMNDRLARHLDVIGADVSQLPWAYLSGGDKPLRLVNDIRRQLRMPSV